MLVWPENLVVVHVLVVQVYLLFPYVYIYRYE